MQDQFSLLFDEPRKIAIDEFSGKRQVTGPQIQYRSGGGSQQQIEWIRL
jgi:hypothetical protein